MIEDESRPYWDGLNEGRLLIKRCSDCGAAHFYPRPFCPDCWSGNVDWEAASGAATLYTWSMVHQNDLPPFNTQVPYIAAVVDLAEGPRMMTRVVDCDEADLVVGMALSLGFTALDDELQIPVFRPA